MSGRVKASIDRWFDVAVRRLPLRTRLRLTYLKCHRRLPNFRRPARFSEFCQLVKFLGPELSPFVDKIAVKDIVGQRVGHEHLIPTFYAGATLPPVEERNWPLPFIVKTSHTSGGNISVRERPDWPAIERQLATFLAFDYSQASGEQFYKAIPPRVLVEPLIGDGSLVDYKIFTFGGKPAAIQVDNDRETDHRRAFFDPSWKRLDIRCAYPNDGREIDRPAQLDRMPEIASLLGADFPFVRVDLYQVGGQVYFGELTFSPGGGMKRIEPPSVELEWGKLWSEASGVRLGQSA